MLDQQQSTQNRKLREENERLNLRILQLEGLTLRMGQKFDQMEEQIEDLQCRSMQNNLLLYNIEEKRKEDTVSVTKNFLVHVLKLDPKDVPIDTAHRMGKPSAYNIRPIVVHFVTQAAAQLVKTNAKKLKGLDYRLSEQLPKEVRLRRSAQVAHLKHLRQNNPDSKTFLQRDQLYHAGQKIDGNFTSNAVKLVPTSLPPVSFANLKHTQVKIQNKSKFQGHAYTVTNLVDVRAALAALHQDGHSTTATHIIYAYRIIEDQMTIKGHSDDGEWTAGGLLANSLQQGDKSNVFVAVTRHYGGTDIGPQRFAIIRALGEEAVQILETDDDNETDLVPQAESDLGSEADTDGGAEENEEFEDTNEA